MRTLILILCSFPIMAQTVMPAPKVGSSDPAKCITGEMFFNTSASAGSNIKGCTATDTWTAQGGSGSPSSTVLSPVAFASLPAAGTAGRVQFFTDAPFIARDNGSSWDYWCQDMVRCYPAGNTTFGTTVNTSGATLTSSYGVQYMQGPSSGAENISAWVKSIPSHPYTITARVRDHNLATQYTKCGLILRESSSGKMVIIGSEWSGGVRGIGIGKFTDATTYAGSGYTPSDTPQLGWQSGYWIKIVDNSTNRVISYSSNGVNWIEVSSVSRTDHLTPDQVGIGVNPSGSSTKTYCTVESYRES